MCLVLTADMSLIGSAGVWRRSDHAEALLTPFNPDPLTRYDRMHGKYCRSDARQILPVGWAANTAGRMGGTSTSTSRAVYVAIVDRGTAEFAEKSPYQRLPLSLLVRLIRWRESWTVRELVGLLGT